MSFFYAEQRAAAKKVAKKPRLQDIPITSLQKLGCSVCPRDEDDTLDSPKMEPSGKLGSPIYLLGSAPSTEEDEDNNHWTDKAGTAIYGMFGSDFMKRYVRSNFIQQCRGDQTHVEIECCRNRIVSDIERCAPEIVVCIGDAPLAWATSITSGALTNRGQLFVARIGRHVCYAYSILYPNYVHKRNQYGKSEFQLALEHDIAWIKQQVGQLEMPRVWDAPYDTGVEVITGNEADDLRRLERALIALAQMPRSADDIEATGLRPYMQRDPLLLSAAVGTFERTVAFAIEHPEAWGGSRMRQRQVLSMYGEYLVNSGRKAAHNLAMEHEWHAYKFGTEILRKTEWDDTMALCHTLDEREGTKSLGYQTRKEFGFDVKTQSRIDVRRENWWLEYPLKEILRYNGMDTKWTDKLRDRLMPRVLDNPKYAHEYERKVRLASTLVCTEDVGLVLDFDYARMQQKRLGASLTAVEEKLRRTPEVRDYQQRFGTFQCTNSDHHLKLYKEVMQRPEVRVEDARTGKVSWSTDEEVLQSMPARDVPSALLILEHRGQAKLLGTYVEPALKRKWVCTDGRVRSKYASMKARTGRLTSEDPNAQNFPKRKHKEIRGMIVPPPGCLIVPCDYGQIEFRVIGMASEDENLVKYAWTGYDVHGFWAKRIVDVYPRIIDWVVDEFGIDWDEGGHKVLRQEMKNRWVFPQFFGSSVKSCASNLHIPLEVGQELADEFWDEFPGVLEWQGDLMKSYERNLYVETLGGRRRRGPMTKNEIINLPIQGTACDIVTEAMNVLSERAERDDDPQLQPVLNVHDDLTFYIHEDAIDQKLPIIAREMCLPRFDYVNVPLIVEASAGKRWHEVKEVGVYRSTELFNIRNPYEERA